MRMRDEGLGMRLTLRAPKLPVGIGPGFKLGTRDKGEGRREEGCRSLKLGEG